MKKIIRYILILVFLLLIGFAGLLVFSSITDFDPKKIIETDIKRNESSAILPDTLSVLIWNIGYMGLGADVDFFNDGGKNVRANEALSSKYRNGIIQFLSETKSSVDFMLLQEVDFDSKRSYHINQSLAIDSALSDFSSSVAVNYNVQFVPVPFQIPYTPYGKTYGGLQNVGRFNPSKSTRVQYPGGFSWPTKLYMLDRCALEWRFPLKNGKEFILVNTHNTAYDETGEIKKVEMTFMKARYESETKNGNLVVIGGDWNQTPPGVSSDQFSKRIQPGYTAQSLTKDILPNGFKTAYDVSTATNRSNVTAYEPGQSYTTLIDYFMFSPGVDLIEISAIDLRFQWSDHQPVLAKFVIKP